MLRWIEGLYGAKLLNAAQLRFGALVLRRRAPNTLHGRDRLLDIKDGIYQHLKAREQG